MSSMPAAAVGGPGYSPQRTRLMAWAMRWRHRARQATLDELRRQTNELRRSRARIVAAADAERRRMERDLHDGAQQHLVALAVNLRLARDVVTDDPAGGTEMLDQLAGDVQ